jgi:hypothetical protein
MEPKAQHRMLEVRGPRLPIERIVSGLAGFSTGAIFAGVLYRRWPLRAAGMIFALVLFAFLIQAIVLTLEQIRLREIRKQLDADMQRLKPAFSIKKKP